MTTMMRSMVVATAMAAVAMKGFGETSNDVSETMRPKAMPEKIIARNSRQPGPHRRRFVRSSVISS